ncbi:hypothetical protein JVU11DRAFT_8528 [Chiua virens]|nr:hypothetical protein JVU11DRAFT_8528 [Chiua virens]
MMILRVWAIYDKSRLILGILLVLFFVEVVSTVAFSAFNSNPKGSMWVTSQILEYSYCTIAVAATTLKEITLGQMAFAAQTFFSVMLCMLATIHFVKESLQMYRVTKQWQLNRYINLLVKQGIVYFFAFLLLDVITMLYMWGHLPINNGQYLLLVPVYILPPRFIISIRNLHEHDVQCRRGGGIDSGFGLSTLSVSGRGDARSPIAVANRVENEATENIEADVEQDEGMVNIRMVPRDVESG